MAEHVVDKGCAILDLFGHTQLAGFLLRDDLCGSELLRVDVPSTEHDPGFTRYVGLKAIYALTLVDEAAMRTAVQGLRTKGVTVYRLPESTRHYLSRDDDDDDESMPY